MRILYVTHRVPFPPRRGGKIRPFHMISHLSRAHEVTVASLARSEEEEAASSGLAAHCHEVVCARVAAPGAVARMLMRAPTAAPFSMGYFFSPVLRKEIGRRLSEKRFDFVFVHCSSVAQYVENVTGIPKLLDFGDMDSQKWHIYGDLRMFPASLVYRLEAIKLEAAERRLAQRFDLCSCTTREELATLDSYRTGVQTDWFPNGVDHGYFAPAGEPYDPNLISFVGRMDYYPNQDAVTRFCTRTLPLIQRARPDARFVIVGAEPSRGIRALASLPGVTVTGSVADVRPFVARSAVNVAPLRIARGTQNKILEAMALAVPVVASSLAARGVDATPDEHLVVADTPEEEARAVVDLLEHPDRRARLAQNARARVLSHHDWQASMRRLDEIVERCLATFAERNRAYRAIAAK